MHGFGCVPRRLHGVLLPPAGVHEPAMAQAHGGGEVLLLVLVLLVLLAVVAFIAAAAAAAV